MSTAELEQLDDRRKMSGLETTSASIQGGISELNSMRRCCFPGDTVSKRQLVLLSTHLPWRGSGHLGHAFSWPRVVFHQGEDGAVW